MFSTSLDCGNINNGVACDSIKCSMPDKGFAGVCSSDGLGHNSGGKSLKTSLPYQRTRFRFRNPNLSPLKAVTKSVQVILFGR